MSLNDAMQATYNSLFLGYVKNGRMEELLKGLVGMKERNIKPTSLSLQTVISGFLDYKRIDDVLDYLPYLKVRQQLNVGCYEPFSINLLLSV